MLTSFLCLAVTAPALTADGPFLFREPTLSKTHVVFHFAGDLWSVPRQGGSAVRLTSGPGEKHDPSFSPDGKWIAYTATYDGNPDAYLIPAEGGIPKRLTSHPAPETVVGWSPDGSSVLVSSSMLADTDAPRLFKVGLNGSFPVPLPLPSGSKGSFSPDGKRIAYMPGFKWQTAWKRYRGGQASPIWIADLADSRVTAIPRDNENNESPMWFGDKVYYLSDKKGPVGLYSFDLTSKRVTEEIPGGGFDLKSAAVGPDAIVLEKLGGLQIFDPKTKSLSRINVQLTGDFPQARPQYKNAGEVLMGAAMSPSGSRVVAAARGWLFSIPASKGDVRLIDETQGVTRKNPAWSPDGKTLAYTSDEGGTEMLVLRDMATNKEKSVSLGEPLSTFQSVNWSPDSSKISYLDNRHQIWILDVVAGTSKKVDAGLFEDPNTEILPKWSPDSKWLTYSRDLENHLNGVFLYEVASGKKTQVTDGLSNAKYPVFDRDGKHLYFHASTNTGWAASYLDMTSLSVANVTSSLYVVVLRADGENPFRPESDEEALPPTPPAGGPPKGAPQPLKGPEPMKIDLDGIQRRIMAIPSPARGYGELEAGTPGTFFAIVTGTKLSGVSGAPTSLVKFSWADKSVTPFASIVGGFSVNPKGDKMLLAGPQGAQIVSTMMPPQPGQGAINISNLQVKIDPLAEWKHIFDEVVHYEPIFFYDAALHGVKMDEMKKRYEPFLPNIRTRADLNYLLEDVVGELSVGHMWVRGGDVEDTTKSRPATGLLGADYVFESGKYKISRIYDGESWNPGLVGPLSVPGVNAKVGDFLLEVDGKPVVDAVDLYALFEGKAGKQVKIRLGATPDGKDSRVVTVVPTSNEFGLRNRAWAEDNRRYVEKMTNGRAGYVHVPDTGAGGWTSFQRYYFAQANKDGMVVDERFNHGGLINDYMIHEMKRTFSGVFTPRNGRDWATPGLAVFGPKVMLINQYAGSGGDMFPWLFRYNQVGKMVGKRTWGGLVRAFSFPLVDGGAVNSPDTAFYNPHTGKWDVEGYGVAPDVEVELDPYLWRQGRDAQLDKAIEVINKELANFTAPKFTRPAPANRFLFQIRW